MPDFDPIPEKKPLTGEALLKAELARTAAANAAAPAEKRAKRSEEPPAPPPPPDEPVKHKREPSLKIPARPLPADDPWTIRRLPESAPDYNADTEVQLNALIGELHFFMREVVYRYALQSTEALDRLAYLDRAMGFAETGAKMADAVGRLRSGGAVHEMRQRVIVERVHTQAPGPQGEGGKLRS